MALNLRKVVTGHDKNGRATVISDGDAKNIELKRPGASSCVVWSTDEWPITNNEVRDRSGEPIGTVVPNGTVFRVVQYEPGVTARRHRTESIDYAVVVRGEIDMELDDEVVHLNAGDMLVQRATVHNWVNRGSEPCVIAFVLISAEPAKISGKVLGGHG